MADTDPLAMVFEMGTAFMTTALPDWKLPDLLPLSALPFDESLELRDQVRMGDHIAVRNPSGYWHHGIFFKNKTTRSSMVVEVWGESKETSKITSRTFAMFVAGGKRFALIKYADDAALPRKLTAALALHLLENAGPAGFYNVASNNCEHFATFCRTLRCENVLAVAQCLQNLPEQRPQKPYVRGFK
jgi:hypothetical protein